MPSIPLSAKAAKLMKLCDAAGFACLDHLLSALITDSVCPAICMTEGCDYTTEMEPDQTEGLLRGLRRRHRRLGPRARRPHLMEAGNALPQLLPVRHMRLRRLRACTIDLGRGQRFRHWRRPGSGRRSDRAARSRRSARTNRELQVDHSSLAVCGPDARRLAIDRAPAARTVADVEAANAKVKEQVLQAQSVTSELIRLHAVKITACENVDASHLDATAAKATAFLRLSSELGLF
jgi:hypothetical protein